MVLNQKLVLNFGRSMMRISVNEILVRYAEYIESVAGRRDIEIERISDPDTATPDSLVFLTDIRWLEKLKQSAAPVIGIDSKLKGILEKSFEKEGSPKQSVLYCTELGLLQRELTKLLFIDYPNRNLFAENPQIHPSATVSASASIGNQVEIGPGAVIGEKVVIGEGTRIGANVVLERGAQVGQNCLIYPHVFVGHHCEIGDECQIKPNAVIGGEGFGYVLNRKGERFRLPHQGRVIIKSRVDIGSGTCIDRGTFLDTVIGEGTKIDNLCHIAHNCTVGANSVLTGGFMMAGSSHVGKNFIAGGRANVTGHVRVGDNVQLAGLSAVGKDIEKPGQYGGYPLLPIRDHFKATALISHLPEIKRNLKRVMKSLGLNDEMD